MHLPDGSRRERLLVERGKLVSPVLAELLNHHLLKPRKSHTGRNVLGPWMRTRSIAKWPDAVTHSVYFCLKDHLRDMSLFFHLIMSGSKSRLHAM
jgi:hypothetical protein